MENNKNIFSSSENEEDTENSNDTLDISDEKVIRSKHNYDDDMWITAEEDAQKPPNKFVRALYDFVEMLALVTIVIVLCFSFIFRLNIVDGPSMNETLHTGEYLIVSDLFYKAKPGDIVVIQDMTAGHYNTPIVKRVIAVEGQTVDIDFDTWTLTVDGEVVDESDYRYLEYFFAPNTANYVQFPLTVNDGHVFVMGDNRYSSADSRLDEIGQIDERCIVGKVYARVFPFDKFKIFKNPYED